VYSLPLARSFTISPGESDNFPLCLSSVLFLLSSSFCPLPSALFPLSPFHAIFRSVELLPSGCQIGVGPRGERTPRRRWRSSTSWSADGRIVGAVAATVDWRTKGGVVVSFNSGRSCGRRLALRSVVVWSRCSHNFAAAARLFTQWGSSKRFRE
jgi:hypothetical protein